MVVFHNKSARVHGAVAPICRLVLFISSRRLPELGDIDVEQTVTQCGEKASEERTGPVDDEVLPVPGAPTPQRVAGRHGWVEVHSRCVKSCMKTNGDQKLEDRPALWNLQASTNTHTP